MWEDRFNRSGGRWCLNLNKSQRTNELDNYWLYTVCFEFFFLYLNFESFVFSLVTFINW
jgi:hypothetical protein